MYTENRPTMRGAYLRYAPLYFTGIYLGGIEEKMGRFLWTVPLAFILPWVYKHTHGSLLMSVLSHTSIDFQGDITYLVIQALPG